MVRFRVEWATEESPKHPMAAYILVYFEYTGCIFDGKFYPVYFVRYILSGMFCPGTFCPVYFGRYVLYGYVWSSIFCPGIFCPSLFCPGIFCPSTRNFVIRIYYRIEQHRL